VTPSKAKKDFMKPTPRLKPRDLTKIQRQLEGVDPFGPFEYFPPRQREDEARIREALRRKFPVRIGSVSDPFQEQLEQEHRHIKEDFEMAREIQVSILTLYEK